MMRDLDDLARAVIWGCAVFLAVIFILGIVLGRAIGHDIYGNWMVPGSQTSSCCHGEDCRPTRAFVDDEGRWRAWNGSAWLVVPEDRILPTDYAHDGRSHLCEKDSFVYCFTPGPEMR